MNKRILLVDDERNLNQLIATNLKFEGYETESAYSGIEAIDKLGRFSPDLVVLDVMMPGMDGFEVLEHLRHVSSIPVILLTAKIVWMTASAACRLVPTIIWANPLRLTN